MGVSRLHADEAQIPVGLLGSTGLRLSRLVLGTAAWTDPSGESAEDLVTTLLDAGGHAIEVNDLDGGVVEEQVGALIGSVVPRDELVLIARNGRGPSGTRVAGGIGDSSRRGLVRGLDETLSRLRTEHVDLWLVDGLDGVTPVEEVAATMEWAVRTGRATSVGIARVAAWQAVDLGHHLRDRGVQLAAQAAPYSLLQRWPEDDIVPAASSRGHGVLAAMPLGGGILTGKYRHGTRADSRLAAGRSMLPTQPLDAHARAVVESLATAAEGLGVHPTEVALAWALQRNGIDALLVGARTSAQLRGSIRGTALALPQEIIAVLDEVSA